MLTTASVNLDSPTGGVLERSCPTCPGVIPGALVPMKLFNLCNHLVGHYCFHTPLTKKQRLTPQVTDKLHSQGSGSPSQASLLINQLCPRVSPRGHQATCSPTWPGSSFPEFSRGLSAPANPWRADGVWGGGKKRQPISPTPSLSCPQYTNHKLRWVWSDPCRQGQESWVPRDQWKGLRAGYGAAGPPGTLETGEERPTQSR